MRTTALAILGLTMLVVALTAKYPSGVGAILALLLCRMDLDIRYTHLMTPLQFRLEKAEADGAAKG